MANFLAELKRRNIYRVGAVYAVVAWVLLQLVANVAPILDLPPWIARTVLLLLERIPLIRKHILHERSSVRILRRRGEAQRSRCDGGDCAPSVRRLCADMLSVC